MAKKNINDWEDDLDYSPEDSIEKLKKPWMKDKEFILVRDYNQLKDFVEKCKKTKICGLDFESTGLNLTIYPRIEWDENQNPIYDDGNLKYIYDDNGNIVYEPFDKVVGICLAADDKTGYYVPIRHYEDNIEKYNLEHDKVFEILNEIIDDPSIILIMHNAKFDIEVYYTATIHNPKLCRDISNIDKFEDTMLLAYLWESDLGSYSLKWLSKILLGYEMIEINEMFNDNRSKKQVKFDQLHPLEAYLYGCSDALITVTLYQHLVKKLKEEKLEQPLINKIEKQVTQVLRKMQRNKVTIDTDYFIRVQNYMAQRILQIQEEICKAANREFNASLPITYKWIDSTQQLGKVLFEDLGIEGGTKTEKANQWSTNDQDLERLKNSHAIINLLRTYRSLTVAKTRYVDPFTENIDYENKAKFQFQQTVVTGRFKSNGGDWLAGHFTGVNVQSIPACYNAIPFKAKKLVKRPFIEGFERFGNLTDNNKDRKKNIIQDLINNGTVKLKDFPTEFELENQYVKFFTSEKNKKKWPLAAITYEELKKNYLYYWLEEVYCAKKTCEGCPLLGQCEYKTEYIDLNKDELNIRKGFIAQEGFILIAIDFSGVELRVAANISKEDSWVEQFVKQKELQKEFFQKIANGYEFQSESELDNPYGDLHTQNAKNIFGPNPTKEQRQIAKVFGFQLLYGASARGVAQNLRNEGYNVTDEEAEEYYKKFFEGTPKLRKWIEKQQRQALKEGRVSTPFGRIRKLPQAQGLKWNKQTAKLEEATDSNEAKRLVSFGKRSAINSPVQGGAADVIKIAMGKILTLIEKNKWEEDCKLLLTVHDELVFEIREEQIDIILPEIVKAMVNITESWSAPLKVDAEIGKSWFVETEYGTRPDDLLLLKITDFENHLPLIRNKDIKIKKNLEVKKETISDIKPKIEEKESPVMEVIKDEILDEDIEENKVENNDELIQTASLDEKVEDSPNISSIIANNYKRTDSYPLIIQKPLLREKAYILRRAILSCPGDTLLIVLSDDSITLIGAEQQIYIDPKKFEAILRYEQLL